MADWKEIVGSIAPGLATALGGPLAGAAVKVIADKVLGAPNATEEEVAEALSSGKLSGDQILAIKRAEQEFLVEMAKIDAQADQSYLQDVQDARARQVATKDYMPQTIFFLLLGVYVFEISLFWFGQVPTDEFVRALMTRAFSTVEVGLTGAIAYFIGSSRGSKNSGDTIRKLAEQGSR